MHLFKLFGTALIAGFLFIGILGCEQEGPAEHAGEEIDEATEQAQEAIEEAGDEIEQKTDQ